MSLCLCCGCSCRLFACVVVVAVAVAVVVRVLNASMDLARSSASRGPLINALSWPVSSLQGT